MSLRSYVYAVPAFCFFFVSFGLTSDLGADSFYFIPADSEVDACSQTHHDVEVWIGSANDIQGYSLEITYASDLFLADIVAGDLFPQASYVLQDLVTEGPVKDTLAVDGACLGCSVDGPGHLFTLRFGEPWPCGLSDSLKFNWCLWANSNNDTTYLPGNPGTITVSCVTAVKTFQWGGIKSLYR
jgi:hypothetical protein